MKEVEFITGAEKLARNENAWSFRDSQLQKTLQNWYESGSSRLISITWDINIIYSVVWNCPVVYFRGFYRNGALVSYKFIQTLGCNATLIVNQ
jgi:hypothetical protein